MPQMINPKQSPSAQAIDPSLKAALIQNKRCRPKATDAEAYQAFTGLTPAQQHGLLGTKLSDEPADEPAKDKDPAGDGKGNPA